MPTKAQYQETNVAIKDVLVANLKIDRAYARPTDPKRVEGIVDNFNEAIFDVPTVNDRTGEGKEFYVILGCHRSMAARKKGIVSIKARVLVGLSQADEARIAAEENQNTKKQDPFDRFNYWLVAGEPGPVEIAAIINDTGLSLVKHGKHENQINAIGALERVYNKMGADTLREALALITEIWAGNPDSLSGKMIEGMATFLRDSELTKSAKHRDDLVRKLSIVSVAAIIQNADHRRIKYNIGAAGAVSDELLGQYNKRRRTRRLAVVA